jgi:hypothetical protein
MRVISPLVAALSIALVAPLAIVASGVIVEAQESGSPEEQPKQIPLTDQQIQSFIAAQKDIEAITAKAPQGDQPDPKVMAALDTIAQKYNFANYAEYSAVADNIGLVMSGIDPQTKKHVGAETVLKSEIADVKADETMSPKDKQEQLEQLKEQLQSPAPAPIPGNIDLVTKDYDRLNAAAPQGQE